MNVLFYISFNMPNTPWVSEWKEWLKSPQVVKTVFIASVLWKWDMVVHLRSRSDQKYIPEYFEYSAVSPEVLNDEISKSEVEPKVFSSLSEASNYIRDNLLFVTDTYVLNPPWTQMFFVYQLGNIRYFKWILDVLEDWRKWADFILSLDQISGSLWDDWWRRKPEWLWFDDNWRPIPSNSLDVLSDYRDLWKPIVWIPLPAEDFTIIDKDKIDTSWFSDTRDDFKISNINEPYKP